MIKTERIKIYPASREQMERILQAEKDDELKKSYGEMLEGCLTHPDQWDWYAMWMIEKTDGTHIGDLCFKGIEEKNPEIGYGTDGWVNGVDVGYYPRPRTILIGANVKF